MIFKQSEALFLRDYYSERMIGKVLEQTSGYMVDEVRIDRKGDGEYLLRAICKVGGDELFSEISTAAKQMFLISPVEVLNQMQSENNI
jgi:hypothetical protein